MYAQSIKTTRRKDSLFGPTQVTAINFVMPLGITISGKAVRAMKAALYFKDTPNDSDAVAQRAARAVHQLYEREFVNKANPHALIPDKANKAFHVRMRQLLGPGFLMLHNLGYIY